MSTSSHSVLFFFQSSAIAKRGLPNDSTNLSAGAYARFEREVRNLTTLTFGHKGDGWKKKEEEPTGEGQRSLFKEEKGKQEEPEQTRQDGHMGQTGEPERRDDHFIPTSTPAKFSLSLFEWQTRLPAEQTQDPEDQMARGRAEFFAAIRRQHPQHLFTKFFCFLEPPTSRKPQRYQPPTSTSPRLARPSGHTKTRSISNMDHDDREGSIPTQALQRLALGNVPRSVSSGGQLGQTQPRPRRVSLPQRLSTAGIQKPGRNRPQTGPDSPEMKRWFLMRQSPGKEMTGSLRKG